MTILGKMKFSSFSTGCYESVKNLFVESGTGKIKRLLAYLGITRKNCSI